MKFFFIYIKNSQFGNGHFTRISNLKKKFKRKYQIKSFNIAESKQRILLKKNLNKKNIKIFLDVSNRNFFLKRKNYLNKIFKECEKLGLKLNLIDSHSSESIIKFFKSLKVNIYINPYVDKIKKSKFIYKKFLGSKYLIGLNKYDFIKNKKLKKNVLVFFTASRSTQNEQFIDFVQKNSNFFSKYSIKLLSTDHLRLKNKYKNLKFVKFSKLLSHKNFNKIFKKIDFVISGSGNFKYEMLRSGVPLIIISSNDYYKILKKRLASVPVINFNNLKKLKELLKTRKWEKGKIEINEEIVLKNLLK